MNNYTYNNIESSRREYDALPSSEWRKDYFNEENGGFVVTHVLKGKDVMKREGIAKEVLSCLALANIIFIVNSEKREIEMIEKAIKSEIGRRKKDNAWLELPDVYVLVQGEIVAVWNKKKAENLCL